MTSKLSGPPFSWEPRLVTNVSVSKSPPWSEKDRLTSTVFFLQNRHRERVYNHRITNQGAGDRPLKYPGNIWGYFGELENKFSCARIADKTSDLDPFRPFMLTEVVAHPIEIVHAIESATGNMLRATIAG